MTRTVRRKRKKSEYVGYWVVQLREARDDITLLRMRIDQILQALSKP